MTKNLNSFNNIYSNIKEVLDLARKNVVRNVNFEMVQAYWNIGRIIVEEEQKGKERAEYGSYLIKEISKRLTQDFGKGFGISNIKDMREFYSIFKKSHALPGQFKNYYTVHNKSIKVNALRSELTWTHYRLLIRVENENARNFYINESINSKWSTRELERQINSLLFERLALSKDKKKVKELASKGQIIEKPIDLIKDPYILEFLDIKESSSYLEKDLES